MFVHIIILAAAQIHQVLCRGPLKQRFQHIFGPLAFDFIKCGIQDRRWQSGKEQMIALYGCYTGGTHFLDHTAYKFAPQKPTRHKRAPTSIRWYVASERLYSMLAQRQLGPLHPTHTVSELHVRLRLSVDPHANAATVAAKRHEGSFDIQTVALVRGVRSREHCQGQKSLW
jgi:hypothetical protein